MTALVGHFSDCWGLSLQNESCGQDSVGGGGEKLYALPKWLSLGSSLGFSLPVTQNKENSLFEWTFKTLSSSVTILP